MNPSKPFPAVMALVQATYRKDVEYKHLKPWDVLAVCVQESLGQSYWCLCDSLCKANLQVMESATGVSRSEFVASMTVKMGEHKNEFPKFRFEISWYKQVVASKFFENFSQLEKAVISCSWGLGQKSAFYKFGKMPAELAMANLRTFNSRPDLQMGQIWDDLEALGFEDGIAPELVFTRYNAGSSANKVNEYGRSVLEKALLFESCYEKDK